MRSAGWPESELIAEHIAGEWTRMTFTTDPAKPRGHGVGMMMGSRETS